MYGKTARTGYEATDSAVRVSICTENEKKQLSEASRMLKSSMGFAIAVCAGWLTSGSKP